MQCRMQGRNGSYVSPAFLDRYSPDPSNFNKPLGINWSMVQPSTWSAFSAFGIGEIIYPSWKYSLCCFQFQRWTAKSSHRVLIPGPSPTSSALHLAGKTVSWSWCQIGKAGKAGSREPRYTRMHWGLFLFSVIIMTLFWKINNNNKTGSVSLHCNTF